MDKLFILPLLIY